MERIYVVDAFSDEPYSGNPAAVVLLTEDRDDEWMRSVAAEMKHSETAFVDVRPADGQPRSLRWFTPEVEVALCGHATLATAHVLGGNQRFHTKSGELQCVVINGGWIEMDFPLDRLSDSDEDLSAALPDIEIETVLRGAFDVLVVTSDETSVREFAPDFETINKVDTRGVILTAPAHETDFVDALFAPRVGVPEDPVTGSAHTSLAAYWSKRLGKTELTSRQVSQRPGTVRMSVRGSRVGLKGRAVTVLEGNLRY